ncbi:MAG TPA: segregation/condensation protein A, partial [Chthoniobacterales bacterium]|nr:segregation/condensation protein A [Chthoniobacterales bacterium]
FIMRSVAGQRPVAFFDLFETAASRTEIAVTFLALLELIRMRQIRVYQDGLFAEIEIRAVLN